MAEFIARIGGITRKSGRIGGPDAENRGAAAQRRNFNTPRERQLNEALQRDVQQDLAEGGVFETPVTNNGPLISASYGPKCILTLRYANGKRKSKYVHPSAERLQARAISARVAPKILRTGKSNTQTGPFPFSKI